MLRWLTAGESHGPALVAILEGLPAHVRITTDDVSAALARRRLGKGRGGDGVGHRRTGRERGRRGQALMARGCVSPLLGIPVKAETNQFVTATVGEVGNDRSS